MRLRYPLTLAGLLVTAGFAQAADLTYYVTLNHANEVASPCVGTFNGIGNATVVLHDDNTVTYTVTYSGLSSTVAAGHFHGPATTTQNAGVVIGFTDLTTPIEGTTVALTPTQRTQLEGGLWYINLHTSVCPQGEIRGQVVGPPVPALRKSWGQIKVIYR